MLRSLSVAAASLLIVSFGWPQGAEPPPKPTITWHGQSFFTLKTSKGTVVAFDPHNLPEYGRLEGLRADIILMSHKHPDHIKKEVFENAEEKGDKAPQVIMGWKAGDGQETWNLFSKKQVKDVVISSVGVYHDEVQGMTRGINTIFIVEVDGWRICHLGDLGHKLSPAQLKAIGDVDVLMIPCGGIYSLNGEEAKAVLAQLKVKEYIFGMHIGTRIYDDLLPIDEFVDGNPYPVAVVKDDVLIVNKKPRDNVEWLRQWEPKSDNTIVLDRKDDRPRPVIVGLHYWPQAEKQKKEKEKDKEKDKDKNK
jgi:L-ascorbate metabolism protein UlaG (beta-lactamase superfamily)